MLCKEIAFARWAEKYAAYLASKPETETYLAPEHVPEVANLYGILRYMGKEIVHIENRCFAACDPDERSWVNTMNISHTCVYIRGLYTEPMQRRHGYGRTLLDHALTQWPAQYTQACLLTYGDVYPFYERMGFARVIERTFIADQPTNLRLYLMTRTRCVN